jgi:LAO/AO transport system kinase
MATLCDHEKARILLTVGNGKADLDSAQTLLQSVALGDRIALAKAITLFEDSHNYPATLINVSDSNSHVIGITGSPGVGKSTTVNALITHLRSRGNSVAVIAVDPSSPISGGALLGDRIRLTNHFLDDGVYIRSLATRGHLGGLSASTNSAIQLSQLAGFDYVLVETVGVGQSEVEVMRYVQTVLIVLAPGMGDDIQASKAGILEIGNVFLINKSDRDGAEETASQLEKSLHLSAGNLNWAPRILLGAMEKMTGVEELLDALDSHYESRVK